MRPLGHRRFIPCLVLNPNRSLSRYGFRLIFIILFLPITCVILFFSPFDIRPVSAAPPDIWFSKFCAQAYTPSDDSDAGKHAPPWSRDDEPKEECDNSLLAEHEVHQAASSEVGSSSYHHHFYSKLPDVTLLQPSPITAVAPSERHLANERSPSAPPFTSLITESSAALSPKSGDQHRVRWLLGYSRPRSHTFLDSVAHFR